MLKWKLSVIAKSYRKFKGKYKKKRKIYDSQTRTSRGANDINSGHFERNEGLGTFLKLINLTLA